MLNSLQIITIDDTQTVAADGGVAHQCMRVGDYLLFQILKTIGFFTLRSSLFTQNVVEVHEAQSCKPLDVFLSLASLEDAGDGKELAFGLERLAASLAIGGGECLEFLIGADEVGYSLKQARKRKLGGHVFENANVHILSHLVV